MDTDAHNTPGRVIGIGGVFFKSGDAGRLRSWYAEHLGMVSGAEGLAFQWRAGNTPDAAPDTTHRTVWCVFPGASTYFDPSPAPFMLNYIVDDLEAILAKLTAHGVPIDPQREDYDYGRFAWIYDPDGNKIELWEPRAVS